MVILTESKRDEHDKLNSIHAKTTILNLRSWMVYDGYRLHSIIVHIRIWETKNL